MQFDHKTINLQRFPKTGNKSLRPWSAADELLLKTALTLGLDKKSIVIAHDTFGAMAVALNAYRPHSIINQASQLKALRKNLENNGLDTKEVIHSNPLKIQATNVNLALVRFQNLPTFFNCTCNNCMPYLVLIVLYYAVFSPEILPLNGLK